MAALSPYKKGATFRGTSTTTTKTWSANETRPPPEAQPEALRLVGLAEILDALQACVKVIQWGSSSPERKEADPLSALNEARRVLASGRAMLSAAPPQPEREPLTLAQIDGIGDATGKPSHTWHYKLARAIERAHGIGATND